MPSLDPVCFCQRNSNLWSRQVLDQNDCCRILASDEKFRLTLSDRVPKYRIQLHFVPGAEVQILGTGVSRPKKSIKTGFGRYLVENLLFFDHLWGSFSHFSPIFHRSYVFLCSFSRFSVSSLNFLAIFCYWSKVGIPPPTSISEQSPNLFLPCK